MKKVLLALMTLQILILTTYAQAATINAASCSQADLQAAINQSNDGDIIMIPAGTCTWSDNEHLIINKSIYIMGAGTSTGSQLTKIIHDGYDNDSSIANTVFNIRLTSDVPLRVSGIYFDRVSNVGGAIYPYYYRKAILIRGPGDGSYALTKIRIDHNHFNKGLNAVLTSGRVYGLIDSNTFVNNNVAIRVIGSDSYDWIEPIDAGTANALFIENNTFIMDNTYGNGASNEMVYHQQGAKPVVRYNYYNASTYYRDDTPPLATGHPNWGGTAPYYDEYRAQPIYEVYGNNIHLNRSYNQMITFRGGSALVFNNNVTKSVPGNTEYITRFTEEEGWTLGGPWCYPYWNPNTDYSLGDIRQPVIYNGYYYQVTADNGISGATNPNWSTNVNSTLIDGDLTWTNMGVAPCPKYTSWPANDLIINSFSWGNYINGESNNKVTLSHTIQNREGYDDVFIKENREYYLHAPQAEGGREFYISNSDCTDEANPAPCCTGSNIGHCAQGHYDALVFTPNGPNAYYPYTPYVYPHPLRTDCTTFPTLCDPSSPPILDISGDVNKDGQVNILDIQLIVADFTKTSDYNPRADVNSDGTINLFDIMIVVKNWQ